MEQHQQNTEDKPFRKIVLASVAAMGLLATTVAPIDASPSRGHVHSSRGHTHQAYRGTHYQTYQHRQFSSWADANAWIRVQRSRGVQCHYDWHGPNCWVYYR